MYRHHPRHIYHYFLRNLRIPTAFYASLILASLLSVSTFVLASATSNFQMIINPGVLAVGMVDKNFTPVAHPMVNMADKFQSPNCQSTTGTFGTTIQKIYVENPSVADNGWVVTLSAASSQDTWQGDGAHFDFNDSAGFGCIDGPDADIFAGQMTVNPAAGNLSLGVCSLSCKNGGVMKGSATSFEEGVRDTITLLSASAESSDQSDWVLTNILVTQTIPPNQAVSDNYALDLFLSVTAI